MATPRNLRHRLGFAAAALLLKKNFTTLANTQGSRRVLCFIAKSATQHLASLATVFLDGP